MARDAEMLTVPGPHGNRDVRISSPSRILWPDLGITKLDLARYIVDDGEQFFSKNPPKGAPGYAHEVMVVYPSGTSWRAPIRPGSRC